MKGVIRILQKYVIATIFISIFLLIFNFVLLATLVFTEFNQQPSPYKVIKKVTQGLVKQEDSYQLEEEAVKLLKENKVWVMLLDKNGQVQWDMDLPDDVPRSFSLIEVAKFSRYYLMDYPVYLLEHEDGLVVIGYPKYSYWKYQFDFLSDWVRSLPERLLHLLLLNIFIALLISLIIGIRLIRQIRPLVEGIHRLAKEQKVQLDPKGIFSDLAMSINSTSAKLQQKNAALKARDEARSNWIAGISHDIRTPLSIILGYASEMEEDPALPDEQRNQAGIIRRQGEKLRSLVNDLNLVSMLEYEMQPLHLKPLRLSVLARQVATDFLNNGLDERYQIELNLNAEAVQIIGDEKLLLRAISNLVHNSIRHNPQGCKIFLETALSENNTQYSFIVKDDGRGIPEEQLKDTTELPYTSKRKRTVKEGHGLGLPMVSRIVQAHHGQLILENMHPKGLKAIMLFPIQSQLEKTSKYPDDDHTR